MTATNASSLEYIENTTAQLVPLCIYITFATVTGLIGNSIVIYSSIRYNAIQLDKVSVLLVQNLAAADLLYIFTNMIPACVSTIARKYILGKVYCFWTAQFPFIPAGVNTLTVLAIASYRLRLVLSPMNAMTKGRAKVCIAVIWSISSIPTIISLAYGAESRFSPNAAKCLTTIYIIKDASVLFRVVWQSIVIIPLISIVIINILLFTIASKSRNEQYTSSRSNNTRALITVSALSGVFLASWIPVMIWTAWKGVDPTSIPDITEQIGYNAIMINSFCNPILYTITNKRFGSFVWKMVNRGIPIWSKSGAVPSRRTTPAVLETTNNVEIS